MYEGELGREYAAGEVICRQGEPGACMYILQSGRAVVISEDNGTQVTIGEMGPGDVFGEMAIFDRAPRSATVQALSPVRVLILDRRVFLRGVHEDPSLAYRVLQAMSHRIRALTEELTKARKAGGEGA